MKFGNTRVRRARVLHSLRRTVMGWLLLLPLLAPAAETPGAKPLAVAKIKRSTTVDFEREILPILKNNCIACHNQTKPKGGLVLETPQSIVKGGDSGPAVIPKKPTDSLVLKAAAHLDPELIMPPPDNKVAATNLKPEELGLLRLWIEQGATGEVRATLPVVWQSIPAGLNSIYAVALTRDGQFAACGRANQIFIYNLPTARLVARLSDPRLQTSSGSSGAHRDMVNALAFSPDGELLASGGYREVKLWRRSAPVEKFKLPSGTSLLAASADGKWLAAASTNGELRLLDANGKLATTTPARGPVTALTFMTSSDRLAVARGNGVELIAARSGTVLATTEMPEKILSLAPMSQSRLAVACGDSQVRIIERKTNDAVLAVVNEFSSPAPVVLLAANGATTNQVVAASADGAVRVWNVAQGKVAMEMQHGSPVTALALRADGKLFATAGGAAAKLWKTDQSNAVAELKGDVRARFGVEEGERELTFARAEIDFRKLAVKSMETNRNVAVARHTKATETNAALVKMAGEKQSLLTNAVTARQEAERAIDEFGSEIKKLIEAVFAAEQESTNAAALAKAAKERPDKVKADKLAAEADAKARLLDEARANLDKLPAETKAKPKLAMDKLRAATKAVSDAEKEFQRMERTRSTSQNELDLAADALRKAEAAVAAANESLARAEAGLKKAESQLESAKAVWAQAERPVRALAFAPDNSILVTADDRILRNWSAETGAAMQTVDGRDTISVAGLTATTFAAAGGAPAVWNMNPVWKLERVIGTGDGRSPLADRVNALRFTADGLQLFTGGGEPTRGGEIKLWRIADGRLVRDLPNIHSDSVLALDLSADGKFLASGAADRFAKVIELSTGKVAKTLEGHTHHVLGVAWKRDGRTIVTAGADNVAKVWDAITGERRKNIEGFSKEVTAATFVGVGDEVVLSAGDGQVALLKDKGDKVRSYHAGGDYVYASANTPDGRVVVAGGADGVLRAWNGRDGKLLAEFPSP